MQPASPCCTALLRSWKLNALFQGTQYSFVPLSTASSPDCIQVSKTAGGSSPYHGVGPSAGGGDETPTYHSYYQWVPYLLFFQASFQEYIFQDFQDFLTRL